MKSNTLTDKAYWNDQWDAYKPQVINNEDFHTIFTSLFKNYLPYNPNFRCLEVGCVPGNLLIEFHKIFGYKIFGVDYSDKIGLFRKNMQANSITKYKIYKTDILKFDSKILFDVVASFGLIEHFIDPSPYIIKMAKMVKKGGFLIIHVPNFRNIQYIIHYLSDKNIFKTHYLDYMDAQNLENLVTSVSSMETIYCGYYGIIQDFPYNKEFPFRILNYITHNFNILADRLSFNTLLSNRWTSPDTVYIGKKV